MPKLLAHGLYFSRKEADDTKRKVSNSRVSNVKLSSLDFCIQLSQRKLEESCHPRGKHLVLPAGHEPWPDDTSISCLVLTDAHCEEMHTRWGQKIYKACICLAKVKKNTKDNQNKVLKTETEQKFQVQFQINNTSYSIILKKLFILKWYRKVSFFTVLIVEAFLSVLTRNLPNFPDCSASQIRQVWWTVNG